MTIKTKPCKINNNQAVSLYCAYALLQTLAHIRNSNKKFYESKMFGYWKNLEINAQTRYQQKLNIIGLSECPYDFPADSWINNPTEWPEIQWPDVYSYLVETPGIKLTFKKMLT